MVRPPIASRVSSTKPDSVQRIGVDLDLKSCSSATRRQVSIAAGIDPHPRELQDP